MPRDAALVVRANRDSPVNGDMAGPMAYGHLWMGWILNSLRWRGGARLDLRGNDAVGVKFESAVRTEDSSLLVGCGHGNPEIWVGQYVEAERRYSTLMTTYNAELMRGRVVYLLSCNTARKLGPEIIRKGGIAYAGYNDEFVWTVESPESPAADRLAAPFGSASTTFPRALVGGKTVREAKEQTLKAFDGEIERWEKNEDPYAREVVKWLLWDREAFTVLGNEEARGLEPRIALGLLLSAIAVGAVAFILIRRRRK